MKAFIQNTAVKIISFLLVIVLVFIMFFSLVGVYVMIKSDVYYDDGQTLREDIYNSYAIKYYLMVEEMLRDNAYHDEDSGYLNRLKPQKTNFRYTAYDENGTECATNIYRTEKITNTRKTNLGVFVPDDEIQKTHYARLDYNSDIWEYIDEFIAGGDINVTAYDVHEEPDGKVLKIEYYTGYYKDMSVEYGVLTEPTVKDDLFYKLSIVDFAVSIKDSIFIYIVISFILFVFLVVILIIGAGHKKGYDGIYLSKFNRIYFDLYIALNIVLSYVAIEVFNEMTYSDLGAIAGLCLIIPMFTAMVLGLVITFSARVKTDDWYKNTVIYVVLRWLFKAIKFIFKNAVLVFSKIPLFYKTLTLLIGITFVEMLFLMFGMEGYIIFWVFEKIIVVAAVIYIVLCMRKLQTAARKIASGDTQYKTDTTNLIFDFKEHAENLNNISYGLALAVEENVKSERMKAELITNVSHDIKTPLTSIINYVDLLKREGLESENATEYLDVLDRQSSRLKRLTEDLVEASKASTGNLRINFENTDLVVLINQVAGEYQEKLSESELELILDTKEENINVYADGRHLWRVFDNLMNNICKYTMPKTRVYLSAKREDDKAVITFRNISREPLNIDAAELTERFVRGDKSRNTEGSGLGLSIAKSLTELQGGNLDIKIDGDLFKVTITI